MKIQIKFGLNFRGDIRYVSRETKKDEVDSRMKRIRAEEEKFYELKYDYEEKIELFEDFAETVHNLWENLDHLHVLEETLSFKEMFELFGIHPASYKVFREFLDQILGCKQAAYKLYFATGIYLKEAKENEEKFLSKYKKEV